jgi:predicted lipid-binding transport protein (Tim44 family)
MKSPLALIGLILVAALSGVACDKLRPPLPEVQQPPAAPAQTSPQSEQERQAFAQAAQEELDELKAAIAGFRDKAEASGAQAKARLGEEVKKLEADLQETQQRLTALKAATVDSWNQLKESFSRSLETLKGGIENFRKNSA